MVLTEIIAVTGLGLGVFALGLFLGSYMKLATVKAIAGKMVELIGDGLEKQAKQFKESTPAESD